MTWINTLKKEILLMALLSFNLAACTDVNFTPSADANVLSKEEIGPEPPYNPPVVVTPPIENPPPAPPIVVLPPLEPPPVVLPPFEPPPVQPPVVVTPPPTPPPVILPPAPTTKTATDHFKQDSHRSDRLDILIVEDTSLSMRNERWTLHKRFPNLIQDLQGVDWQLGITTTNLGNPQDLNGELISLNYTGLKVLRKQNKNAQKIFEDAIGLDMCNNDDDPYAWLQKPCTLGHEEPLKASILAMNSARNDALFRNDAQLAIILITDEDEKSTTGHGATTPQDLMDAFSNRFGPDKKLSVHSIIIEPGDSQCLDQQSGPFADPGAQYGTQANLLSQLTGGITQSICESDYSLLTSELAKQAQGGSGQLQLEFTLSQTPIAETVQVTISPSQSINWQIDGDKIIFDQAPRENSNIKIDYEYN